MMVRLALCFVFAGLISSQVLADDPSKVAPNVAANESPLEWSLVVFTNDDSGSCLEFVVIRSGTVILKNTCDAPLYFNWCRMRAGTGIDESNISCRPQARLLHALGPGEGGYQVPSDYDHPVAPASSLSDITREYAVITTSFDNSARDLPGYVAQGADVEIAR